MKTRTPPGPQLLAEKETLDRSVATLYIPDASLSMGRYPHLSIQRLIAWTGR
jgi:hypothetical protein